MTSAYDAALVDEAMLEDERLMGLDRSVRLVHLEATVWSKARGTDGRIPAGALRRLTDAPDPEAAAKALVGAGLWQVTDAGWVLPEFLDRQMSRARVQAKREANLERQRRWEERHRQELTNASPNALANASPNGATSQPASLPARKGRQGRRSRGSGGDAPAGSPPAPSPEPGEAASPPDEPTPLTAEQRGQRIADMNDLLESPIRAVRQAAQQAIDQLTAAESPPGTVHGG